MSKVAAQKVKGGPPQKRTVHVKVDEKVWKWLVASADNLSLTLSSFAGMILKKESEKK